jgi:Peptidase M50B-like
LLRTAFFPGKRKKLARFIELSCKMKRNLNGGFYMNFKVANDARPQIKLLLTATLLSVAIWVVSFFLPITNYLVYPLQLFATFIHEGSHVLAAVLTGSSVESLTVSPDTSGVVWSQPSGWFSQLFISCAGYLGTTAFGTFLLVWLRYGFSARLGLYISAGFIGIMTLVFGLLMPIWNVFDTHATFGSVAFTVISGAILTAAIFAVGRFTQQRQSENFVSDFRDNQRPQRRGKYGSRHRFTRRCVGFNLDYGFGGDDGNRFKAVCREPKIDGKRITF